MEGSPWAPPPHESPRDEEKEFRHRKHPNQAPESRWVPLPKFEQQESPPPEPEPEPKTVEAPPEVFAKVAHELPPIAPEAEDEEEEYKRDEPTRPVVLPDASEPDIDAVPLAEAVHDEIREIPMIVSDEQHVPPAPVEAGSFEDIMQREMGGNREFVASSSAEGNPVPIEAPQPIPEQAEEPPEPAPIPPAQPAPAPFNFNQSWGNTPPIPAWSGPSVNNPPNPFNSYPNPSTAPQPSPPSFPSQPNFNTPPSTPNTAPNPPQPPQGPRRSWQDTLKTLIPMAGNALKVAGAVAEVAGIITNPHAAAAEFLIGLAMKGAESGGIGISIPEISWESKRNEQPEATPHPQRPEHLQQPAHEQYLHPAQQYHEARAVPTAQVTNEEQLLQPVALRQGERLVRSSGSYVEAVDRSGHVIHEAVEHGAEYTKDQKIERTPVRADVGGPGVVGSGVFSGLGSTPLANSVQLDPSHELGAGKSVDMQHRLPAPRNQFIATVTSPWLWTAIAILMIVYFLAALA